MPSFVQTVQKPRKSGKKQFADADELNIVEAEAVLLDLARVFLRSSCKSRLCSG